MDAHLKPELPLKYDGKRAVADIAAIVIAFVLMGALAGIVVGSCAAVTYLVFKFVVSL